MCSNGAMYVDEDHYEKEMAKKKFYNKVDPNWDYYSGLPSVLSYKEDQLWGQIQMMKKEYMLLYKQQAL